METKKGAICEDAPYSFVQHLLCLLVLYRGIKRSSLSRSSRDGLRGL